MQELTWLTVTQLFVGQGADRGTRSAPEVAQEQRYLQAPRWGWSCRDESPCATRIAPGNGSSRRRPRKRSRRRTGWRRSWYCWDATAAKRSPWAFPSRSRFAGGRRPRCCVSYRAMESSAERSARLAGRTSMTPGGSYPPTARSAPPWPGAARSGRWRRGRRRAAPAGWPWCWRRTAARRPGLRDPVRRIAAYRRPSRAPGARPGRRPGLRRPAALAGRRRRAPFAGPAQRAPGRPVARRTPPSCSRPRRGAHRSASPCTPPTVASAMPSWSAKAPRSPCACAPPGWLRSSGSGSACGATAACWSACLACSARRRLLRPAGPGLSGGAGGLHARRTPTACWCWSTRAPASGSPRWAGHA